MPGKTQQSGWFANPSEQIHNLFEQHGAQSPHAGVDVILREFASQVEGNIEQKNVRSQVPLLTKASLPYIQPGSLVRYVGMVQDTLQPEYYCPTFKDKSQPDRRVHVAFQDVDSLQSSSLFGGGKINLDDFEMTEALHERGQIYVVPVPGATHKEQHGQQSQDHGDPAAAENRKGKRSLDDDMDVEDKSPDAAGAVSTGEETVTGTKRGTAQQLHQQQTATPKASEEQKSGNEDLQQANPLNFPDRRASKDSAFVPAIVKLYGESANNELAAVNRIVEFYGIFSSSPMATQFDQPQTSAAQHDFTTPYTDGMQTVSDMLPHSQVPRVHCLHYRVLEPLQFDKELYTLLAPATSVAVQHPALSDDLAKRARETLLKTLTELLYGDALAAEYVLLHLLSHLYTRRGELPLGHFPINIALVSESLKMGEETQASGALVDGLDALLEKICNRYVPAVDLTIDALNADNYAPTKDPINDRLVSGLLQVPSGTQAIFNETRLSSGQLKERGMRNLQSLQEALQWGKVSYNFGYSAMPFDCAINAIVVSTRRSLVQTQATVPVKIAASMPQVSNIDEQTLDLLNAYVRAARALDPELKEDGQKRIAEAFVTMRKQDSSFGEAQMHQTLTMARFVAASHGRVALSLEDWQRAVQLETERCQRLKDLSWDAPREQGTVSTVTQKAAARQQQQGAQAAPAN
eukprot:Clim_evm14s150 gene=Clim_evmTU14s150